MIMAAKFNKPWFDFLHARAMGEGAHEGITGLYEMMDQDEFNRTYLKLIKQTIAGYDERLHAFREKLKVVCRAVNVDWKEALDLLVEESEYEDTISYLFSMGLSDEQVVDICEKYFPKK